MTSPVVIISQQRTRKVLGVCEALGDDGIVSPNVESKGFGALHVLATSNAAFTLTVFEGCSCEPDGGCPEAPTQTITSEAKGGVQTVAAQLPVNGTVIRVEISGTDPAACVSACANLYPVSSGCVCVSAGTPA